ncbi:endopeptidase La [uncultured Ilyobacter sp.]|jgi:ATP-dependent Lon protease|uniref:endopeptidase La n=1 Tax=uncultured Ilyobacter sp. TaxID=544433 RepID=UPI002AA8CFBB|nr:endopeptidase La [uncultured Ilyobacter sp.]
MADNNNNITELVSVNEIMPEKLVILPIVTRPVFPNIMIPITFSGGQFLEAIRKVEEKENRLMGLVYTKEIDEVDLFKSKLYEVGTVVKIHKITPISPNTVQIIVQGISRFKKIKTVEETPLLTWNVEYNQEPSGAPNDEVRAYMLAIMTSLKEIFKVNPIMQEELKLLMSQVSYDKPSILMDLIAAMLKIESRELQELLEEFNLEERCRKLLTLLKKELEISQLQEKIQRQIEDKVSKQQKDYFLREQLKLIKKELGMEKDDKQAEIDKLIERLSEIELSEEAKNVVEEQFEKLKMIDQSSPEYHVTRSYIQSIIELPWGIYSDDRLDVKKARTILDKDHYGLQDVKTNILEFISTIMKTGNVTGSILCLVGPPGVGKTSIGKSIANTLNRKFYRFSVGGMKDEAEIKGHRRTYIGAMPGKIIQALKRVETSNPVIMLDEIDKIGNSYQGDPASALLEVLDPEQNRDFLDHYLDVRYDLSKILFITTANTMDTIPKPLLDRMEVIQLPGYIMEEKLEIAKRFLIPNQMKEHGLTKQEVNINKGAIEDTVDKYAREAGVRNLEKNIRKIMRKTTLRIAEGDVNKVSITKKNLEDFLGQPIFITEELYQRSVPGVTLGLAWTSMGGATLYIEATGISNKEKGFRLTGQLGSVMKESAEIAHSYVRSYLNKEKDCSEEERSYFDKNTVHLHVPAGATPKDGPSAGITMALALYSLAKGKAVRKDVAMTGELTLTGKVLPIGGIREKTIAARRVGIFDLIIPKDNRKDYERLPDYIKEGVKVHFVDYFEDVIRAAFD